MITLALGVPGAGKSLALQDLVRRDCNSGHVAFVVDRAGEWEASSPRWRGNPPRIIDAPKNATPEWLTGLRDEGAGMVRFPYPYEGVDVARLAAAVGDITYVDDEIDLHATYSGWHENPLRSFCHRGRHLPDSQGVPRVVHVYGAARRPQNLHTDITSLADQILCFRVQGASTLKRLTQEGILAEENVIEATQLPTFHYFLWKSDGTRARGQLLPL